MKKRHILTQLCIVAMLVFSCSKESNLVKQDKLIINPLADGVPPDSTGFVGGGLCFYDYFYALENPPDNSIPGDALRNLTDCLKPYETIGGASSHPKLYAPMPPVTLTRDPWDEGTDDNSRYRLFFNVYSPYTTDAQFQAASATFEHLSSIVCNAIADLMVAYPDANNFQKKATAAAYVIFHPEAFTSDAEKQQFLDFLDLVFQREQFYIAIGRGALRTDVDVFSPYASCINLLAIIKL
jgi:hypothetical protein